MEADDDGLPETSHSDILQALEEFDEERRGEGRWADWQSNRNHKHAIEHEGRLYPVKQIISMATPPKLQWRRLGQFLRPRAQFRSRNAPRATS